MSVFNAEMSSVAIGLNADGVIVILPSGHGMLLMAAFRGGSDHPSYVLGAISLHC